VKGKHGCGGKNRRKDSVFATTTMHALYFLPTNTTWPAWLILHDLITLKMFHKQYKEYCSGHLKEKKEILLPGIEPEPDSLLVQSVA